jgi:hypothetical protein
MQQASAEDRDGKDGKGIDGKDGKGIDGKDGKDRKDGKDGDSNNKVIIKQSNECKEVKASCGNYLDGTITQNSGEDDGVMDMVE